MSVSKLNIKGRKDPAFYPAHHDIEIEKGNHPVVYICSPLSGAVEHNQAKARDYCRFAIEQGVIPLAPHIYFTQFMDDSNPVERKQAMFMDLILLSKCSELWVFGERISRGMAEEIAQAERRGQPIRYFTEACEEVAQ